MVTTNDKISLITDVNNLFGLNDPDVHDMLNGDTYKINELYKYSLKIFKEKSWYKFKHLVSEDIMTLTDWMNYYQCDINDPKSITIFLRLAESILI